MGKLTTRSASDLDVVGLVELHKRNVDRSEFSMLLPESFLTDFYELCVSANESIVNVVCDGPDIVGVSVIWTNEPLLTRTYQRRIAMRLAGHLLCLALTGRFRRVGEIVAYAMEAPLYRIPADVAPYCVGMAILDITRRTDAASIVAFFRMFSDNVERLKTLSGGKIWASAHEANRTSVRMIKSIIKPTESHLLRRRTRPTTCFIYRADPNSQSADSP